MRFTKHFFTSTFMVVIAYATPLYAFDNEPDGFRDVKWGAEPSALSSLGKVPLTDDTYRSTFSDALKVVPENLRPIVTKQGFFGLITSCARSDDKLSFYGAEMRQVTYLFLNEKFFAAVLSYFDSSHTVSGNAYSERHVSGQAPPRHYDAKLDVDLGLKKFFGSPSKKPGFMSILSADNNNPTLYTGDKTQIESNCDSKGTNCYLVFRSVELDQEFVKALGEKVAEANARVEEADRKNAERKPKADF